MSAQQSQLATSPKSTSAPRAIGPGPNLRALSDLSESSTGSWERGTNVGNARSPPTHPSVLSERAAQKERVTSPLNAATGAFGIDMSNAKTSSHRIPPGSISMPPSSVNTLPPRLATPGYGFRPPSGQSTPTTSHTTGFLPSASARRDDDDMDHRPDGQSMEQLRNGVRESLERLNAEGDGEGIEVQRGTEDLSIYDTPPSHGSLQPGPGGIADEEGLGWAAKNTIKRLHATPEQREHNLTVLSSALRTVLECIGEDPDREGLQRTPERYAKALLWMTKGYEERLVDVINDAVFAEDHDEMVIVRDIDVFSLCEHHMVPFTGKVGRARPGLELTADLDRLHPK